MARPSARMLRIGRWSASRALPIRSELSSQRSVTTTASDPRASGEAMAASTSSSRDSWRPQARQEFRVAAGGPDEDVVVDLGNALGEAVAPGLCEFAPEIDEPRDEVAVRGFSAGTAEVRGRLRDVEVDVEGVYGVEALSRDGGARRADSEPVPGHCPTRSRRARASVRDKLLQRGWLGQESPSSTRIDREASDARSSGQDRTAVHKAATNARQYT